MSAGLMPTRTLQYNSRARVHLHQISAEPIAYSYRSLTRTHHHGNATTIAPILYTTTLSESIVCNKNVVTRGIVPKDHEPGSPRLVEYIAYDLEVLCTRLEVERTTVWASLVLAALVEVVVADYVVSRHPADDDVRDTVHK